MGGDDGRDGGLPAFGPYTLTARLGSGGMGEVYRAHDAALDRYVAIKILRSHLTADPERRARFAREARLLATLNHPNVGAIYGVEESNGVTALILELVEGPTLADQIKSGPLPVGDIFAIAQQIAAALAAAHEKGIVHRDLKPSNIVLQDGSGEVRVRVLDFGLAKSLPASAQGATPPLTESFAEDGEVRIHGTPAYMSPEQSQGRAVDKRTDIWAFGCVLFEMASGKRAFEAGTVAGTLARVLEREPDWGALPLDTPPALRTLIRRCLSKDPRRRLQDIGDALIEIDDERTAAALDARRSIDMPSRPPTRRLGWLVAACGAAIVIAGSAIAMSGRRVLPDLPPSLQFTLEPPPDTVLQGPRLSIALSPGGTDLAMVAVTGDTPSIWVAPLVGGPPRQLLGTDDAMLPFWSPDGRRVGFFTKSRLKTVALDGGAVIDICDARPSAGIDTTEGRAGAAWTRDGRIIFASPQGHLQQVPWSGGTPTAATRLEQGEVAHGWPSLLPDNRHFLFVASGPERRVLKLGSLASLESRPIGPIASAAVYASGHILFVDAGLMAQRFDVDRLERAGEPFTVAERVGTFNARGSFTVSDTGVLAYRAVTTRRTRLTWLDREGNQVGSIGEPGLFANLSLAADDRRVAVSARPPGASGGPDIWIFDLERQGDATRLTTDPAWDHDPAWSPDGKQLVFNSNRTGRFLLYRRASDGSGNDVLLSDSDEAGMEAPAWSPDGANVIFAGTGGKLWLQKVDGPPVPSRLVDTTELEDAPSFSPDGRWVVYASKKTGRSEIYVRPFPSLDREHKISRDGGLHPRWRSSGEIFFLSPDRVMMSAMVSTREGFRASIPTKLFPTAIVVMTNKRPYDVTRDGRRFLIPISQEPFRLPPITIITSWTERAPKSPSR